MDRTMKIILRNKKLRHKMIEMKMDKKWKNKKMKMKKNILKEIKIIANNNSKRNMKLNRNSMTELFMAMKMDKLRNNLKMNTKKHSSITRNNMMKMMLNISKVDQKKENCLLMFHNKIHCIKFLLTYSKTIVRYKLNSHRYTV